jgi:uncharacterized membrane protein (UPF0127 family)
MHFVSVQNLNHPSQSSIQVRWCSSFLCRLRGLTFRRSLADDEGLLLVQKRENRSDAAIHMLFVWIDLAVIWINSNREVVDVQLAKRWRPFYIPKAPAQYVLEISPAHLSEFNAGDCLSFEEIQVD